MRQPPSPLLLSARKRRLRRNPPRGGQVGTPLDPPSEQNAQQQAEQPSPEAEKCALLERTPPYAAPAARPDDEDSTSSSR